MNLRTVTLTGIDQFTNIYDIYALADRFKFAEFGILLSESKMGIDNRYPPIEWIKSINRNDLQLSCHLCGSWARDLAYGGDQFVEYFKWHKLDGVFNRIQLNISNIINKFDEFDINCLISAINNNQFNGSRFIIQIGSDIIPNWCHDLDVDILFDASGGKGVGPTKWPLPVKNCGYAGGLNPDNLNEQLQLLSNIIGDNCIWIDAESGVRSRNVFDYAKAYRFLDIANRYINGDVDAKNCCLKSNNTTSSHITSTKSE